jgi:tetratricopeptide (TPR) repeat protein
MLIRDSAILKLLIFGLMAFIVVFTYWGEEHASRPGWLLMAAALIGLLLLFDLPNLIRRNSSIGMLMNGLDQSIAIGDHERAEELLNVARRRLGLGKSKMHQHLDLAEGTMNFREGRYEQALESLERCFLNAFAINDTNYGTQSGVLLLKTLVALGRYNEASEFGMGVRQLTDAPEVEHLVALANNRKESLVG